MSQKQREDTIVVFNVAGGLHPLSDKQRIYRHLASPLQELSVEKTGNIVFFQFNLEVYLHQNRSSIFLQSYNKLDVYVNILLNFS